MKSIFLAVCCIACLVCGQAEAASGQGFIDAKMGNIIPDQAKAVGLDRTRTLIVEVAPNGPADKAGIKPNDVILSIDGESMADATACFDVISSKVAGTQSKIVIWRNGQTHALIATIAERPQPPAQAHMNPAPVDQAGQTAGQTNILPSIDIQNVPCEDLEQCFSLLSFNHGNISRYNQRCKRFIKKELIDLTDIDIASVIDKELSCKYSKYPPSKRAELSTHFRPDMLKEAYNHRNSAKESFLREKAAKEAAQKLCPGLEKEIGAKYKNHYIIVGPEMGATPKDGITLYDLVAAAQQKGMFKKFKDSGIFSNAITLELEGMSIDFQSRLLSAETFLEVGTSYKGQVINVLIATEVTRPDGRKNRIGNSQAEMFMLIGFFGGSPLYDECR